jgi:hypothetical protein
MEGFNGSKFVRSVCGVLMPDNACPYADRDLVLATQEEVQVPLRFLRFRMGYSTRPAWPVVTRQLVRCGAVEGG